MLNDAVAHYHELLNDRDLAQQSLTLLDEGLDRAKLIFGGRRLSPYLRPHFVTEGDFAWVVRTCDTVWGAIEKVKDAAVADESLLDELGSAGRDLGTNEQLNASWRRSIRVIALSLRQPASIHF